MKRLARIRTILLARHRARHGRDRESGVAMLLSIAMLALLIALTSEFTYGTSIHAMQAANARDELRAHYLARSAVSISRLLIKIQSRFVAPVMKQAQQLLASSGSDLPLSLRVTDYAGPIMGFFGGSKEEVSMLGGLIGLDVTQAKGLGLKSGRLDAEITAEDGKIDINCGGGTSSELERQSMVARLLYALVMSPRYDKLFTEANKDGRFIDRTEIARAILDWADGDYQMFALERGASTGPEDYRYDTPPDPYRAHDNSYDTVDEVGLVRGMNGAVLEAMLPYLTVYAGAQGQSCKVNLAVVKGDCTPLLVGLVRAAMIKDPNKPPADPTVLDDTRLYPLASILCERGTAVGFDSLDTIVGVLKNPAASIARDDPRYQLMQSMRGINIEKRDLESVAYVGEPRVYRIVATGEAGKVKKKITAIIDTSRSVATPVTRNPASEKASGVLQYWREE
jgi:type II secretory pathway component PulK